MQTIYSNIPNNGERIILFSLIYRVNVFDESLFRLTHPVVKNKVVRYNDSAPLLSAFLSVYRAELTTYSSIPNNGGGYCY